ncbi:MAG: alpha/beta fold hydrolase [Actinomycetota bacterium]
MRQGTVRANGIEFAYLEDGEGPLVLLVHGFPDVAQTWEAQMRALAAAGYRTVAPNLRGYPPTSVPDGGYYDAATLTNDVVALIEQLGGGPVHYVGHDWGAAIGYRTLAAHPELFARSVQLAIPHPLTFATMFLDPAQIRGRFHFWFFQMKGLAEAATAANDFAMIDYLWKLWSPKLDEPEHRALVKRALAQPGALEASLAYYRASFGTIEGDPALGDQHEALNRPISVPTLTILGDEDPGKVAGALQAPYFTGPMEVAYVDGTGHFLHREKPDEVSKLIVDWLASA